MGRIRTVKPELLHDERIAMRSDTARLLYYGLLGVVDDAGVAKASPEYLHGAIFWGQPRSMRRVKDALAELEQASVVRVYMSDGGQYLQIREWAESGSIFHQRIDHKRTSSIPELRSFGSTHDRRGPVEEPSNDPSPNVERENVERENGRTGAAAPPRIPDPPHPPEPSAPEPDTSRTPALGIEEYRAAVDAAAPLVNARVAQPPDPRIRANHEAWKYASDAHAKLRAEGIQPHAPPWPGMPVGTAGSDLVERTRELFADDPDPERVAERHRRRVDVAVAESRRDGHLRWIAPTKIYHREQFWRAVELHPEQVRARGAPRSAGEQPTLVSKLGADAWDPFDEQRAKGGGS